MPGWQRVRIRGDDTVNLMMVNASRNGLAHVAAIVFTAVSLDAGARAVAQPAGQNMPALGMYSLPSVAAAPAPSPEPAYRDAAPATSPGPLARLVRNPNQSAGLPPFALTDQTGRIQRYVEPVPGIDLQPHVGRVVVVRHDTGQTLLATQLELPPQPMYPLLPDAGIPAYQPAGPRSRQGALSDGPAPSGFVQRAQFVDDDDTTVQLLPESEGAPSGDKSAVVNEATESIESAESMPADFELPGFPPGMPHSDEVIEEIPADSMSDRPISGHSTEYYPQALDAYPHGFDGMEPCPQCGGYHFSSECGPYVGHRHGRPFGSKPSKPCTLFADLEINFIRTHLPETAAGKLSEKYEFSPRLIFGFRDTGKADGRVRYWSYDRDTRVLAGTPIRVDFDVLDVEGTHSLMIHHSELTVGAGFRLAAIELTDDEGDTAGADLIGMTLSAEGRTPLFLIRGYRISGVYGGRLSLLGGDWGGDPGNDFTGGLVQDDNVVVHELQAGFDVATCYRDIDVHARLGFEMQNWHSDALGQNAGTDSIGFLGPGLQIGAEF